MKSLWLISVVLSALVFSGMDACAQQVEIGIVSSPKASGLGMEWVSRSGTMSSVRACLDLNGVLDGKYRTPGFVADYHMLFRAFECRTRDFKGILSGGPGVAAGFARNRNGVSGAVAGVSGMIRFSFVFNAPLSLSAGLSAMLGCHISMDHVRGSMLTLYEPGIYRAYMPEITISYRF